MSEVSIGLTIKGEVSETRFCLVQDKDGRFLLSGDSRESGKQEYGLTLGEEQVLSLEGSLADSFEESREVIEERLYGLSEAWRELRHQGFDTSSEDEEGRGGKPGYTPDQIYVEPKPFSISQFLDLIKDGDIEIAPSFQRNFIWDKTRQSRLIESILLGLPLPSIYLSQYKDGRLTIVDGLQRLSTIRDFMDDKLVLCNMEYLVDCDGRVWSTLSESISPLLLRRFKQTQIMCFVIDYRSPQGLKFDLFKRLNTGGKPLNDQEIRNCLSRVHVQNLLQKMAGLESFQRATGGSVKDSRLEAQELALRFIYFVDQYSEANPVGVYDGKMDEALNGMVERLDCQKEDCLEKYLGLYDRSLNFAFRLFGWYAFRKVWPGYGDRRRSPVNKLLHLTICVLLQQYEETGCLEGQNTLWNDRLAQMIQDDPMLFNYLTFGTNGKANIEYVFRKLKENLFDPYLTKK